jgi:hypothetical protein
MFPEHERYEDSRDGNFRFVGEAAALPPHRQKRSPSGRLRRITNSNFVLPREQLTIRERDTKG